MSSVCVYCLGLFLAHEYKFRQGTLEGDVWFNASSDHLYELQVPKSFPVALQQRLRAFRNDMLEKGHGAGMLKVHGAADVDAACREAKSLLLEIDKVSGLDAQEGDFQ